MTDDYLAPGLFGATTGNFILGREFSSEYRSLSNADRWRLRRMSRAKRKRVLRGRRIDFDRRYRETIERARPFPCRWAVSPVVEDFANTVRRFRTFRDAERPPESRW